MSTQRSPKRWANDLTAVLNAAFQNDRFPVRVKQLALDFSHQRFPDDPIANVLGGELPGFEGGLFSAEEGKRGWGIIYNSAIKSNGRINFTIAHEFGHYLLHRLTHPDGFQCGTEDMAQWDSRYGKLESEANDFAATLLMPLDDFRRQVGPRIRPDLKTLGECADRYDVSLTASILRWLQYTERRSLLVVSRDEFILWARSSEPALKSGRFFRTSNTGPVSVPSGSLAAQRNLFNGSKGAADIDTGIWFPEPCNEEVLFSSNYDCTFSLIHLGNTPTRLELEETEEDDAFDWMMGRTPGSSWLG